MILSGSEFDGQEMPRAQSGLMPLMRDNSIKQRDVVISLLLCGATLLLFVVLHSDIGINDIDAYAYIEGARSLRQGLGYVDTAGSALNTWPPGYSLLLSRFQDPLWASYWINAL